MTEEDIDENYLSWFADPEVTRFLDARNINREDALDNLRRGHDAKTHFMYAICLEDTDRHIGNLKVGPIDRRHRTSDLVTVIGDRTAWGRGCARAAISIGIDLAFTRHDIRKLSASIDGLNVGSLRAYTAAGFEVETSLKDQFMHEDGLSDKIYVACFNPKFAAK